MQPSKHYQLTTELIVSGNHSLYEFRFRFPFRTSFPIPTSRPSPSRMFAPRFGELGAEGRRGNPR